MVAPKWPSCTYVIVSTLSSPKKEKRTEEKQTHRHAGGAVGLHGEDGAAKELVKDGVLTKEVRAEQVLAGGRVHQQLVHAPEQHLEAPCGSAASGSPATPSP